VRSRLDEADLAEGQRSLQLLIERVIVGEDSLEIRHVIPLGRAGGEPSGPGPEGPTRPGDGEGGRPRATPGLRPNWGLRSDGVYGLKWPAGTPSGRRAQVVVPQPGQVRRCRRYSSKSGSIRGNSAI
jgi:hypothetical protein